MPLYGHIIVICDVQFHFYAPYKIKYPNNFITQSDKQQDAISNKSSYFCKSQTRITWCI